MSEIDETIARNGNHASDLAAAESTPIASAGEGDADATDDGSGSAEDAATIGGGAPALAPLDIAPGFMSELSVAMRTVVARERDRIATIVKDDAAAHQEQAREQSLIEAEAFRRVADEDVAAIETWAEEETERIRAEAARKIEDRRADLEAYLAQHNAVLEGELSGIETAVGDYEARVGSFLDELEATDDPAEIASRAHALPRPPDLETVRSLARASALTRLAEASMADDLAAGDEPEGSEDAASALDDEVAADEAPSAEASPAIDTLADAEGDPVEATATAAEATADATWGSAVGTDDLGWGASGRESLETADIGLAAMVDEGPTSSAEPVGVMDPIPAAEPTLVGSASVATHDEIVGHPNAAVRLIRSVAPWTAPSSHEDRETRPD